MFNPISYMQKKISALITEWLSKDIESPPQDLLYSFNEVSYHLKPCDVVLVDGRSRVSQVIKIITQSRWSHAALYIGRIKDLPTPELQEKIRAYYKGDEETQLLLESQMGVGVIAVPLTHYKNEEIRICRPSGINKRDAEAVVTYAIKKLGLKYDIRQILDLARFMFPWQYMPRQWRTSLFEHNAGDPTQASCSRLLADAFASVNYPLMPEIIVDNDNKIEIVLRNTRLITPSDFDNSPFFDILKYPRFDLTDVSLYQKLKWRTDMISNDRVGLSESPLFAQPYEKK